MLVLFFGDLSFGARGGLQKPVVREKANAAILAAVPDSTCHDSGGVGQVGATTTLQDFGAGLCVKFVGAVVSVHRCVSVSCKLHTSHVTLFSCLRACVIICHTTLAHVFVRVISSMCHAPE